MKKLVTPFIVGVAVLALAGSVRADAVLFAELTGDQETPPNDSQGFGRAIYYIPDSMDRIYFEVHFFDLTAPATAAHVHSADPGVAGPIILPFHNVPSDTEGIIRGILTEADFIPNDSVPTFADAIQAMIDGHTYTNVHNSVHPGGEIRGQIEPF
jgi:hypothetical protein